MKYLIKLLYIFSIASVFSCHSELDVSPEKEIVAQDVLNSEENLSTLLVGVYNEIGRKDLFGGGSQIVADLLGSENDLKWHGTQVSTRHILEKTMSSDNVMITNHWTSAYKSINLCNLLIDHLYIIKSEQEKNRIEGEALFLRSLIYFDLIRLYAQPFDVNKDNSGLGLPLRLTGITDYSTTNFNQARETIQTIYSQILADLLRSEQLLNSSEPLFADKYAAKFLLARVYIQMGDYENALIKSNEVIAQSGHSMNSNYSSCFNSTLITTENVFTLYPSSSPSGITNLLNYFYSSSNHGGTSSISVDSTYFNLWPDPTADERKTFFTLDNDLRLSNKYQETFGVISLFRLSEMYLIRAESNIELGSSLGAIPQNDFEKIQNRSGVINGNEIVDFETIFNERRRELAFEGFLIHDIKRRHINIGSRTFDDPSLVLPIPQSEMNANNLMIQNLNY